MLIYANSEYMKSQLRNFIITLNPHSFISPSHDVQLPIINSTVLEICNVSDEMIVKEWNCY